MDKKDPKEREIEQGYCTAEYLAEKYGLSTRRVQQLRADGAFVTEKTPNGQRYNIEKSYLAYGLYLQKKLDSAEERQRALRADADYKERKAELLRLELDRQEGRLLDCDDVEMVIRGMIVSVRGAVMSLPGRMAKDLAPLTRESEVADAIKREVTALLNELALKYDPDEFRRLAEEKGVNLATRDEE